MTKARDLADLVSAGSSLADGAISVAEISDLTASAAELNQLDNTADLPDIRPSLLLDFANSKTLDPRITFTRGSTATYWDGKTTAKAEENLLKYSQDFDDWSGVNVTSTESSTTAPDGTTTADTIDEGTVEALHYKFQQFTARSSETYTLSVYLKAGTTTYAGISINQSSNGANFAAIRVNLSSGVIEATLANGNGTLSSSSITDVGNGWYRCVVVGSIGSGTDMRVSVGLADDTTIDSNSSRGMEYYTGSSLTMYAWGAQLEQRSSATAYTPTTDSPIVKYQPTLQTAASGEARFDHDPVTGESKGLLIEESRTNLVGYSAASVADWSDQDLLYRTDSSQNALGVFDGVIAASAGADWHRLKTGQFATTDGQDYAVTAWVQKGSSSGFRVVFRDDGNASECRVTATWGSTTLSESSDTQAGTLSNFSIVYLTDTIAQITLVLNKNGNSTATNIAIGPNSATSGDTVIVLGAQVEEGSFPTSYIPTSGSTVTRADDDAKINDVSEIFNPQEFTFYFEGKFLGRNTFEYYPRPFSFIDPSNAGQYSVGLATQMKVSGDNLTYFTKAVGGTDYQSTTGLGVDVLSNYKTAVSATTSQATVATNGVSSGASVNEVYLPDRYTQMTIGGNSRYQDNEGMHVKKIAVYEKAFTSAQLVAMTEE